ncbi:MAG: NAD(P)/FAD-dependent oxidoreductase [Actinomycetota bacterium]|jgi:cation diffusion facilitator CzcD-associated flavoprotein CzcO|nr:NAD(P)/FAD-dependent oxidoreductase [Acidimicrobiales bacterium]MED6303521.1 NAD(P)/FAD-dependent oxidoreductase [Actinomycetota bacterium]|tara:strand:- start:2611 stop:4272 length:1662 start_codon:yes stop_codon:yes gene_type:complete
MDNEPELDHDVIVVGAGVAGIYQIKRLTDMGLNATVLEADPDLGGTWYNNRYPGARFDSESYTYGYSFSREVLDEWHWKEMFSGQPENLKYLNFVVDKFDLRQYMQFNCRVQSAIFDDDRQIWNVTVSDDRELSCRFLVLALGLLSQPTMPRIPGVDDFQGRSWHTYGWPHEEVDLSDQRVGIIGTGATAIQVIGEIADKVGELTVFQRRPNWVAPLNNSDISAEQMVGIRDRYDEIFETCARTPGGFEHEPDRRGFYEVTAEERYQLWDRLYEEPGFSIWLRNFREIFTDEKANAELSEYMAERIRGRVTDPVVAEKLVPKDHGFGVQRVPMETNYLEAYNRENVHLVDINETPLERVTDKGIRTTAQDYEFDVIVYATGFDAITGSFDHIDIRGRNGLTLREKWFDNPSTFLGMLVSGFPNLLMPSGPQSGSASTNYPRGIENGVNWCTDFFEYMRSRDLRYFEATEDAEKRWTEHVVKMYSVMLMRKAQSWFTGYNSNVEGHEAGKVRYLVYNGGTPKYVATINDVAAKDYEGIRFDVDSKMPRDVLAAG